MVNVMQQLGASVGLAVLVAVFGTASRNALAHPAVGLSAAALADHAKVHGISVAFTLAALFDLITLVVVAVLLRDRKPAPAVAADAASAGEEARTGVPVPDLDVDLDLELDLDLHEAD